MSSTSRSTRRRFLKATAAGIAPLFISSGVMGQEAAPAANDRIRVGVIGCGVRGKYLIANMPAAARVVALCDAFLPRVAETLNPTGNFAKPLATFREQDAAGCRAHQDYRRMLERETLDAVVIAAPDHHHVLAAMLACQAGKDVYVEKPLSLTIAEGRKLVDAVNRTKRIVQVGSQQRTMEMNRFACEFLRDGGLGKISLVELPNLPGPMKDAGLPAEDIPEGLDWNLFCGPCSVPPHNKKLWVKDEFQVDGVLWRGWDLWEQFSGHLMTNWGGHSVDMIQYALGVDESGPVEIWPLKDGYEGEARKCPVAMRYKSGIEMRFNQKTQAPSQTQTQTQTRVMSNAIIFHGERGTLRMGRNRFSTDPKELVTNAPDPSVATKWVGAGHVARPHLQNWLDCIRSRLTPNAPIEFGHRTATICHLANIARSLDRRLYWDPTEEQFIEDDEANALRDRPRRQGFELPTIT
jgi:predicted dehydrogenase